MEEERERRYEEDEERHVEKDKEEKPQKRENAGDDGAQIEE